MKQISGGLDVADQDGGGREPWVKITLELADQMAPAERARCKQIYRRALADIKAAVGTR